MVTEMIKKQPPHCEGAVCYDYGYDYGYGYRYRFNFNRTLSAEDFGVISMISPEAK